MKNLSDNQQVTPEGKAVVEFENIVTVSVVPLIQVLQYFDLNLSIGGRFKLLENFSENLMFKPGINFVRLHTH